MWIKNRDTGVARQPPIPQAANIERAGFAVLGVVISAIDAAGAAAAANGLNVSLDAQVVADVKAIAAAVKGALPVTAAV